MVLWTLSAGCESGPTWDVHGFPVCIHSRLRLLLPNVVPWRQRHTQLENKGFVFTMLGDHDVHGYEAQCCFVSTLYSAYTERLLQSRVETHGTEPKAGDVKVCLVFAQMCFQNSSGGAKNHLTLLLYLEFFHVCKHRTTSY